jgi:hypothetical protein
MKHPTLTVGFLLVVLTLAARLIPGPRTIDDAFITFRYARNLIDGVGFVYNPGERVMGTTTPFYTLLMAGLGGILGGSQADFPWIALVVNALADCGTALLLWRLGRRFGSERAGAAAGLVWAVAPFSVTFAIGGLETSLYVLLLTAVIFCYIEKHLELAGFCAALALLTRVDALILAAPLGLDWLERTIRARDRFNWKAALAFLIPAGLWYGFAGFYFGNPFPHSVAAKLVAYRLEPDSALIRLVQHYATPFIDQNLLGAIGIGIGIILYPFLFLLGGVRAWREEPRSLPWMVYPVLYFLAFALPNPLIFRWYLTPPLPAYFLGIFLGLDRLINALLRANRSGAPAWRGIAASVLIIAWPLISTMSEWKVVPDNGPSRPAPDMAYIQLELLYRQAADIARPHLSQGSVLAAGDVGVLGFYTSSRILDTVGLNSPVSTRYYPLDLANYVENNNYAVAPNLIIDQRPDIVIILEVYGRNGLLKDPRFLGSYELVKSIDTDMYGSRGMLIYARR